MADKLRFGVAGLGRIGWCYHCDEIYRNSLCELAAVADTDPGRRAEAESAYGCWAFADFGEMISSGLVDAVVIATPTHLHEPMACAALDKGLHVILEKPMAPDLAAAMRIAEAASRAHRQITVYQPHRLRAYFQHILRIVSSGRLGRVVSVQRACFGYGRRNDWQSLKRFGGGMLNNYGAHYVDQILQLIGYDVERVFCSLQLVATMGDADDVVKAVLVTSRGVTGDLLISQASTASPYEFVIYGTCGSLELAGGSLKLRCFDPSCLGEKQLDCSLMSEGRRYPSDKLDMKEELIPVDASLEVNLYSDFVQTVGQGRHPYVPVDETIAVMKVLDACRRDAGPEADFRQS